jgi:hypothetical protein
MGSENKPAEASEDTSLQWISAHLCLHGGLIKNNKGFGVKRINIVRTMDSNHDNITIITIIMIMTINGTNSTVYFLGYVVLKRKTNAKTNEHRRLHYRSSKETRES